MFLNLNNKPKFAMTYWKKFEQFELVNSKPFFHAINNDWNRNINHNLREQCQEECCAIAKIKQKVKFLGLSL